MKCNVPKLTAKEMKALREECQRQFDELLNGYNRQAALQLLHVLHFDYGFGQKRLETFSKRLNEMQTGMRSRYELTESDTAWICEQQLRADRIDVDTLLEGDKK